MNFVRHLLRRMGITRANLRWMKIRHIASDWFLKLYITRDKRKMLAATGDPVRFGTFFLSCEEISRAGIEGSLAECGVYKGSLSKFIHEMFPDRKLFLFDTFAGFNLRDSDTKDDHRFADTSEQSVLNYIGDIRNIIIRKGYFPETAGGLERERFALVVIDFDKYEPTLAALNVFYPLVNPGGFIFIHDYCSPESNWACSRAVNEFLRGKPEKPILIPDAWGTALFRKI